MTDDANNLATESGTGVTRTPKAGTHSTKCFASSLCLSNGISVTTG
jgi:hypothetical protein